MVQKIFTKRILLAMALCFSPIFAFASGGFGGVSASAEENSFNVTWNWNLNNYKPGKSTNYIKICYKKKNTINGICKKSTMATVGPALVSNLKSNTKYKIKVECFCKKKKNNGKWKKAKWRKVGTLTQSTKSNKINPDKYSGVLSIIETSPSSFKLNFAAGNVQGSDIVRVCYKKSNAWNNLKSECRNRHNKWTGKNGNRLGYMEKKPGGSFQHVFHGLRDGKQYKFVAVVFATDGGGKVVSTASGHTPKIKSLMVQKKPGSMKAGKSQKLKDLKTF